MKQVVITINGPGEISAWATPLTRALKAQDPDLHIVVCLLPCAFASGSELKVLNGLGSVDSAVPVRDSLKLIALGKTPVGLQRGVDTLLVHLGGDITLSSLMAKRLRAPAFAYVERATTSLKQFKRIFHNGLYDIDKKIGQREVEFIGEMMVDAAAAKRGGLDAPDATSNVIGVFPGSRAYMTEFLLPYFALALDRVAAARPDARFWMARSDYVTDDWLRAFPAPPETRDWQAAAVTFHEGEDGARWFETDAGTRIELRPNAEVFRSMKAALTIPGTNTGEMAAAGIPMVTVLPTYDYVAATAPLPGLAGHIGRIPWLGRKIKIYAARAVLRQERILSQANQRAGRVIVPEVVGRHVHDQIAAELIGLLDDTEGALGREIQSIMGAPGTADRFASEIVAHFHKAAA